MCRKRICKVFSYTPVTSWVIAKRFILFYLSMLPLPIKMLHHFLKEALQEHFLLNKLLLSYFSKLFKKNLRKQYAIQYLAMRPTIFWFFGLQGIDWYGFLTYVRGDIKNLGSHSNIVVVYRKIKWTRGSKKFSIFRNYLLHSKWLSPPAWCRYSRLF